LRVPPYQQNMAKVETELHSPAFSPRTEKWKDHARELAKLDPLKVLESLHKLKEDAAQKLERQVLEAKPTQTSHQQQNTKEDTYLRFKTLHEALKDNPHQTLTKELKHLAKELSQDKDFMNSTNEKSKRPSLLNAWFKKKSIRLHWSEIEGECHCDFFFVIAHPHIFWREQ